MSIEEFDSPKRRLANEFLHRFFKDFIEWNLLIQLV